MGCWAVLGDLIYWRSKTNPIIHSKERPIMHAYMQNMLYRSLFLMARFPSIKVHLRALVLWFGNFSIIFLLTRSWWLSGLKKFIQHHEWKWLSSRETAVLAEENSSSLQMTYSLSVLHIALQFCFTDILLSSLKINPGDLIPVPWRHGNIQAKYSCLGIRISVWKTSQDVPDRSQKRPTVYSGGHQLCSSCFFWSQYCFS